MGGRNFNITNGAFKDTLLPTTYSAQLALMGWFLTLTAKMTGHRIPGKLLLCSALQCSVRYRLQCAWFHCTVQPPLLCRGRDGCWVPDHQGEARSRQAPGEHGAPRMYNRGNFRSQNKNEEFLRD